MKCRIVYVVVGFLCLGLLASAQTSGGSAPALAPGENAIADGAAALSGAPTVSGGGTKNYIPLWLSSSKLGSSKMFQNTAGDIGIGTTKPNATLDVNGAVNATTSFNLGGTAFAFGSASNGNIFLGFAGNANVEGTDNTGSGYQALFSDSGGNDNVATGYQALYSNNGSDNEASGYQSLYSNTIGFANAASGHQALYSNSSGNNNSANGYQALFYNNGSGNTASGYQALYSSEGSTGSYNTATGNQALYVNTASYNTATGNDALLANTSGSGNTADGAGALGDNTTGGDNTAVGGSALPSNSTGSDNTAVGVYALGGNSTGSDLTCIGYECSAGADGLRNATAIGAHAVVSESNALVLGGIGIHAVKVGIGTATPSNILTVAQGAGHPVSDGWETFSSRRWKANIQTLHGALGKVEQLRGVSYDLKANGKHEVGVIAEEVGAVVPEVVTWDKDGKDAQSVDYSRLTALLIEATKEQQALIHQQQEQIKVQQAQLIRLASQVRAIRTSLRTSAGNVEVRRVKAQASLPRGAGVQ